MHVTEDDALPRMMRYQDIDCSDSESEDSENVLAENLPKSTMTNKRSEAACSLPPQDSRDDSAERSLLKLAADAGASQEILSTLMGSLRSSSDTACQVGCELSSSSCVGVTSYRQAPLQVLRQQLMLGPGCDVRLVRLLLKRGLSADMLNTEFNFAIPGVGIDFEDVLSPFVAALLSGVPLQVLEVLLEANPGDAKSVVPAPLAAAALVLLRSTAAHDPIAIPVNGQVSWVGIKGSGPVELHVPGDRISTAGTGSPSSSNVVSGTVASSASARSRDASLMRARKWPQCQLRGAVQQCLRPRVGDRVRAAQRSSFSGVLRDGSLGLVERDDGSSKPFRVRGPSGQSSWYTGEELEVVDPGISRLQTLRHSFVPAVHVAMLAGAPVSLLRELIRLNPEAVREQFALNIPLLHAVLLNQDSYSAADWSALALDVLRADNSAAAVRISSSFPIAVAIQLCGQEVHQEFLVQLALAYLPGYRTTCRELGIDCFDGQMVKSVKHLCQSAANCKTIFQELKRGRWCDQTVVVRCLEETPKVVKWRIAGEYFLWWSLHFGAPCEVVHLWLKVYPEAARHSRAKRSVPLVPLAIAKRYSSSLIAKLLTIAAGDACVGDQVKSEQIRCACEPCSPLLEAALSGSDSLTSLELALHMNAHEDVLHSLLNARTISAGKSPLLDSCTHDPHSASADSLLMLALRREGCSAELLRKFLRPDRRSLVGVLMAISESQELKTAIPHHNLRLLLSLASGEDADAAKVAAGSLALKRELENKGAASADNVDRILQRYPRAVASVRIKPQPGSRISVGTRLWDAEGSPNSGMLPIEYALHLDVPVQALRHLIHAYPEAASVPFESTSDLREGSAQQYLLHHAVRKMRAAFAMVHADLGALLGSEGMIEDHITSLASAMQFSTHMQWAYFVREVFDTAPAVARPTWIDSAMGDDDMLQPSGSPLFDLLCMRREIMVLVSPLLEHFLSVSPDLASSLDEEGRTPLLAAVMHRAPRTVIQVLLRACPEAAGMASRQWKPPFSHIIDACHSGRSGCSRESWSSYLIPSRDWARERLILLAQRKPVRKPSTADAVCLADLPDLAIGKICAGLGAPSVAWLLFQSAPRVIERSNSTGDRALLQHESGRPTGSVDSAFVIKSVQLLLCRCSRPFDARLVQALLERCPEAAQQHLYIEAGSTKELRCLPLHAVLRNQATCAITLAEFLLELFPGSAEVEDSEGWLPLSLVLTLPLPWARIKGLTQALLQAETESPAAWPWRPRRWRSVRCPEDGDLLFGTLVDVEFFGLAKIASQGIILEGRHMGQYEVEYNTGATSYIRPEEIKRVRVFTNEPYDEAEGDSNDFPPWRVQRAAIGVGGAPILSGLLNHRVPTFVILALIHQQPENLMLYDKSVGTALELALRRPDADQLVLPMLSMQPRLASMALSERGFAEVDQCSRLPVALALKSHARAEVIMALVQANPECCEESVVGSEEMRRGSDSACDVLEELLRPHRACQATPNVRWRSRQDLLSPLEDEGFPHNDVMSQETDWQEQLVRQHLHMMWSSSMLNERSNHHSDSDDGRDAFLSNGNSSESSFA